MQRYEAYISITLDVQDADAVRSAAWANAANHAEVAREGKDVFADQMTATTEGALSVLLGTDQGLTEALREWAASVGGVAVSARSSSPEDVRRVED